MEQNKELSTKLVQALVDTYGSQIIAIILYGSVARGTDTKESDIDIAVLIKGIPTKEMNDRATDCIVDLELEYDKVLSVLKLDADTFFKWEDILPFYRNVKNDGVILWKAA